tara:strand:- start:227 stop:460 length:234 start_codon:yes stop_codon:yes gene_type:complete
MTYQNHKQRFGITKNQLQVLNYLKEYIAENEYSPSMREVADACGLHVSAVWHCVNALEARKYVTRLYGVQRSITILD